MHNPTALVYETKGPTTVRVVCVVGDAVPASDLSQFRIMRLQLKCATCCKYTLDGNYYNARQHGIDTALILKEDEFRHHCWPAIRMNTDRFILNSQVFDRQKEDIEKKFSDSEGFTITRVGDLVIVDSTADVFTQV